MPTPSTTPNAVSSDRSGRVRSCRIASAVERAQHRHATRRGLELGEDSREAPVDSVEPPGTSPAIAPVAQEHDAVGDRGGAPDRA